MLVVEECLVIRGGKDIVLWLQSESLAQNVGQVVGGNVKCFPQSLNSQP